MELIDIYLAAVPGYGIMIVQLTDAFVSVGDWIITVEDFGRPIDPIAENVIDGVYLVGYDLEPGWYEVLNGGHPEGTHWARLDDDLEIIDSEASDFGTIEVVVEASDFALEFKGTLRKIPSSLTTSDNESETPRQRLVEHVLDCRNTSRTASTNNDNSSTTYSGQFAAPRRPAPPNEVPLTGRLCGRVVHELA